MAEVMRYINAAKDGYVDILKEASKKELNAPDENGMTATMWAASMGKLEALRLIVGREGDVNKADYHGMTALHHAAMRGHIGVVSYLVNWGCNVYALDNDLHSALDLAAMDDRQEIVRFLDAELAQRRTKNPKHDMKQKENAIKAAEENIKRYEKVTDAAVRKAEEEHRKRQKQIDERLRNQNGMTGVDPKQKPLSFFKTLTIRMRGGLSSSDYEGMNRRKSSVYSEAVGIPPSGGKSTIDRKIKMKRLESLTPRSSVGVPEFRVSDLDSNGNRTLRSVNQGFVGSTTEVLYIAGDNKSKNGNIIYRAKSESDLLDSGTDTYNDEEDDDENNAGIFNRPEFGKLAFLTKNQFLNSLQSFEDTHDPTLPAEVNDVRKFNGHQEFEKLGKESDGNLRHQLPWDTDDLGNLDDDEEEVENSELSAVNMFLWSCGLASYLHIFSKEKIDMQVLVKMTDSELKELGLEFGPRKKLQEAIIRRKSVLETPANMIDTHL